MTGSFRVQLINMGTRAAACKCFRKSSFNISAFNTISSSPSSTVQAKLRGLHDYHLKLLHSQIPVPSGVDIANTIKYFSQTLLSKLRKFATILNIDPTALEFMNEHAHFSPRQLFSKTSPTRRIK